MAEERRVCDIDVKQNVHKKLKSALTTKMKICSLILGGGATSNVKHNIHATFILTKNTVNVAHIHIDFKYINFENKNNIKKIKEIVMPQLYNSTT